MKRSEIISKHYRKIAEAMVDHYRTVIECDGRIVYKVYIWEDGELEYLQDAQGSTAYLRPRDAEPRELFYVWTIEEPCFDVWDHAERGEPDDEAQRESEREEIIDWLVSSYEDAVDDLLDEIIKEAKYQEKDDEFWDRYERGPGA